MKKEKSQTSYSHIIKYTGLFGGVQIIGILVSIVRTKFAAWILGPVGIGMISLFNSTIKFVSDLTNMGISMSAVNEISKDYDAENDRPNMKTITLVRSWCFIAALIGMIVCVIFAPLLNRVTFDWGNHTRHFVFLSPVIGSLAILSGELAILKGTRHLAALAKSSIIGVVAALLTSVPLYLLYGFSGIVPSLDIIAVLQLLITFSYSRRIAPYHLSFSRENISSGLSMIRLGLSFVLACAMASGSDFIIRAFINHNYPESMLGLYNAGFIIAFTYAGMVFSSMETDYYPRLSAIKTVGQELNDTVSRQIEVSLLLVTPILVFLLMAMPLLIPLLFSSEFNSVIAMSQAATLSMLFRAVYLPLEYVALSRGDSVRYFVQEFVAALLLVLFVVLGFKVDGLFGAGIGLTLAAFIESVFVVLFVRFSYGYVPSHDLVKRFLVSLSIMLLTWIITFALSGPLYWISALLLITISALISLDVMKRWGTRLPIPWFRH